MSESPEDYDVFVSYYEDTADDYAERIRRVLSDSGYKVFVAHIERPRREGNFEEYVNNAIDSSHTFIFINTINALSRPQVIREFQQSFPNGDLTTRSLWIFKHDMEDVPHGSAEFKNQTNIDLSSENQSPFKSPAELAYSALSRCKKRKLEKSTVNEFVQKNVKLNEEQRKDYSELLHEKIFAKEFEKRGYVAEFQREIGNHLSADLILQKNNEWIIQTTGSNMAKVLEVKGIDKKNVRTNNVFEIAGTLGIEASRNALINELNHTLGDQGLEVDNRYIMLVSDLMCSKGYMQQIGRHGIAGSKDSVLARAAFEITVPTIAHAALTGEVERLKGITENVIVGSNIPVGSGTVDLYMQVSKKK
ncbi:MAG: TIR domain-containing protein [Thaumarchaeota archaeon]|nr:TIR domain-containing protein [Nitrososphaerota archaeon]